VVFDEDFLCEDLNAMEMQAMLAPAYTKWDKEAFAAFIAITLAGIACLNLSAGRSSSAWMAGNLLVLGIAISAAVLLLSYFLCPHIMQKKQF